MVTNISPSTLTFLTFQNYVSTTFGRSAIYDQHSQTMLPKWLPAPLSAVTSITPTWCSSAPQRKTWLIFIRIQSTLARFVTMLRGRISISKTLSDLHWLPMKFRVHFKVATLTFKVLKSGEPGYLYSRIGIAISRRTLRSSADTRKLSVIPSRTKIGVRAFRHSAPQVWNSLPLDIRSAHPYNRSNQD